VIVIVIVIIMIISLQSKRVGVSPP